MNFTRKAYAKINIGLAVGKKREDGFHPIRSYFARIDLADEIYCVVEKSAETKIVVESDIQYLENGKIDIAEKCARHFLNSLGLNASIYIRIKKNIPFKAGLGGGSADGATVLMILNEFFSYPLAKDELIRLGSQCGSDIPFFLSDSAFAYVEGRGEIVKPLQKPAGFDYVLWAMPTEDVSTASAYALLDSLDYEFVSLPASCSYPINKEDYPNDFERVGSTLLDELMRSYGENAYVSLSGSGSCVYILSSAKDLEYLKNLAPMEMNISKIS